METDLRVLVDNKLSISQQSVLVAKKTSGILGDTGKSIGSSLTDTILSHYSDLIRAHLECCIQFWAPQNKRHAAPGVGPVERDEGD